MKSSGAKTASYAKGGPVTTTDSKFLKTPDRFRDAQFRSKIEVPAPAAPKTKSLPAVKPRG